MDINVAELRKKPQINFTVHLKWMTKMTNEELLEWETATVEKIKEYIESEKRTVTNEEVIGRLKDAARLVERDYTLINAY